MKQRLLIFFVFYAVAAAPANMDSEKKNEEKVICAAHTPCAWTIYNPMSTQDMIIQNTYCICPDEKECQLYENTPTDSRDYVHRCLPPGQGLVLDREHSSR